MGEMRTDDRDQPSLELPSLSLGLGRRARRRRGGDPDVEDAPPESEAGPTADEPGGEGPQPPPESSGASSREPLRPPSREQAPEPEPPDRPQAGQGDRVARPRRSSASARRSLPSTPAPLAVALTGAVAGVAGAGATYAAMAGCEAVRGTSSCGGAPGFALRVAIVAVMVLLGGAILRAFSVPEPTGTSFLAVGIVVVLVMLFLLDAVFSGWMFVVVPVMGAAAYLISHWVTTRFDDETPTT